MALTCNIDARGKFVRLIYGLILLAAAIGAAAFWAAGSGSAIRWTVCIAVAAGGAFAVFEARAGWCVMRAMGFRTPV